MPSWIKEQDGVEWYDEAYTCKQTNQKPEQLRKKVAAGKLRSLPNASGAPGWYARPDVEKLREAFLKRQSAALKWKPTDRHLEERYSRQWQNEMAKDRKRRIIESPGGPPLHRGPLAEHAERMMLKEIDIANVAHKKKEGEAE